MNILAQTWIRSFFRYNLKVQSFNSCFLKNKICFILNMIKTDFLRTKSSKMGLTRSDGGNHSSPPMWYSSFGKRELVKTAQAGLDGAPMVKTNHVRRYWHVSNNGQKSGDRTRQVCLEALRGYLFVVWFAVTKTIFSNVLRQCRHLFFSIDNSTLSSLVDYFWPCYDCNIYWAHNYYDFFFKLIYCLNKL